MRVNWVGLIVGLVLIFVPEPLTTGAGILLTVYSITGKTKS